MKLAKWNYEKCWYRDSVPVRISVGTKRHSCHQESLLTELWMKRKWLHSALGLVTWSNHQTTALKERKMESKDNDLITELSNKASLERSSDIQLICTASSKQPQRERTRGEYPDLSLLPVRALYWLSLNRTPEHKEAGWCR